MDSPRFALALAAVLTACSSDQFELAAQKDAGDGGAAGSGGSTATGGVAGSGGSGGSSAGAGGTGGSVSSCPSGSSCAPVPTGWDGPLYVYRAATGSTPPACPNADAAALDAFIGLKVDTASCGCTCSGTSQCAASLDVTLSETGCGSGACSTKTIAAGNCVQLDQGCSAWATVSAAPTPGPCTPNPSPSLPTPTWSEVVKACKAKESSKCAAGTCVEAPPTPFGASVCIGTLGNQACDAPYPNKTVAYKTYQDTRACEACTCAAKKCGQVSILPNGCGSSVSKGIEPGTCGAGYAVGGGVSTVWARYAAAGGGCSPSKPSVTGTVVEAGEYTLCCTQ